MEAFKLTRLILITTIIFLAGCYSDIQTVQSCNLFTGTQSEIPNCLRVKNSQSAKLLYEWVYLNDDNRNSLEDELSRLAKFKLEQTDYFFWKAEIYFSHKKIQEAISLYEKADEMGSAEAGERLYHILYIKDKKLAFKYLKSAASKGNSDAEFILGGRLFNDLDDSDNREAIKLYEDAAMAGSSQALLRLQDKEVYDSLSSDKKSFWNIVYYVYESDDKLSSDQLILGVKDWPAFCTQFSQYQAQDSIDDQPLTKEKYKILEQVIINCSAQLD